METIETHAARIATQDTRYTTYCKTKFIILIHTQHPHQWCHKNYYFETMNHYPLTKYSCGNHKAYSLQSVNQHHQHQNPTVRRCPRPARDAAHATTRNPSIFNSTRSSCLTPARLGAAVALSLFGVLLLLALEAAVPPPEALPFLHPTLNALYSCANLTAAYGVGVYWQWREGGRGAAGTGGVRPPREVEGEKIKIR